MSMNLFNTLKLQTKDIIKSKSRLKVYNGSKIHPIGKISVTIEYRAKYSVAEFLVVEQNLPNILGLPSCLDLGLIQRVYAIEQENIEDKYKEVFNGLGDMWHSAQNKAQQRSRTSRTSTTKGTCSTTKITPGGASENGST